MNVPSIKDATTGREYFYMPEINLKWSDFSYWMHYNIGTLFHDWDWRYISLDRSMFVWCANPSNIEIIQNRWVNKSLYHINTTYISYDEEWFAENKIIYVVDENFENSRAVQHTWINYLNTNTHYVLKTFYNLSFSHINDIIFFKMRWQ
jgi:hypothetical protein